MNKNPFGATQNLIFFLEDNASNEKTDLLKNFISSMQGKRNWLHSPPEYMEFIDSIDGHEAQIIGGKIEILSFDNGKLPLELDRSTLHDVKFLINGISELSRKESIEFVFELDQDFVGSIKNGNMDRCLSEAFLGEWERSIDTTQRCAPEPKP